MADLFDTTTSTISGPLTEDDMKRAFAAIKRQSDAWLRAPKGPCGCPACTVSLRTRERLEREGGVARCANCGGAFRIDPPEDRG